MAEEEEVMEMAVIERENDRTMIIAARSCESGGFEATVYLKVRRSRGALHTNPNLFFPAYIPPPKFRIKNSQ